MEIVSPGNSDAEMREKARAYLASGAREVWLVSEAGMIRFFDRGGERPASAFPVSISLPAPLA